VMTHAKSRALREELYRANITRASSGEGSNVPIIDQVLALRQEKAALLGFSSFADLSMASKMATLERAEALLEELRAASFKAGQKDLAD
ncbi:putative cytosolic oligopeptidase A, partial [Haematococcus lacustris]